MDLPMLHPGWLMSNAFDLEIDTTHRSDIDNIIFSVDSFNLPELTTQTFSIPVGPGLPDMTYPGRPTFETINLEVTNFYSINIIDFLIKWYTAAKDDIINNLYNGFIIGKDEDGVIRYKADVYGMWPMRVGFGQKTRSRERNTLSASLFVYDMIVNDKNERELYDVKEKFYDINPE